MTFKENDIEWTCEGHSSVKFLAEKFGLCLERAAEYVPNAELYPCYFCQQGDDGVERIYVRCYIKKENGFSHFGLITDGTEKHYAYYANTLVLRPGQKASELYEHLFVKV